MEIWEERYINPKYGKESPTQYKYFTIYRDMGMGRSIPKLSKELSKGKAVSRRIPKLQTLYEYSCKFAWVKRAEDYDNYQQKINYKLMSEKLQKFKLKQLDLAIQRVDHATNNLQQITEDDTLNIKDKSYAIAKNNEAYKTALETVNDLVNDENSENELTINNIISNNNTQLNDLFESKAEALERIKQRKACIKDELNL